MNANSSLSSFLKLSVYDQSFRFGSRIACMANNILKDMKNEKRSVLVGNSTTGKMSDM